MLILLPPSEGKAEPARRGAPLNWDRLSFPELNDARREVLKALVKASASAEALDVLGVSPGLADVVGRNVHLESLPARAATEIYTGVLYAALGLNDLPPDAARRAKRWVVTVSALWGAVRPQDRIPPYRLSMSTDLPGIGPLAAHWRAELGPVLAQAAGRRGVIVDCRSDTYVAAWPAAGQLAQQMGERTAAIRVLREGPKGRTVISHMAKHTRGEVARQLLIGGDDPRSVAELADVLRARWPVEIDPPTRAGKPWTLSIVIE